MTTFAQRPTVNRPIVNYDMWHYVNGLQTEALDGLFSCAARLGAGNAESELLKLRKYFETGNLVALRRAVDAGTKEFGLLLELDRKYPFTMWDLLSSLERIPLGVRIENKRRTEEAEAKTE